jgi:Cu/Ag efflux pump CusA
VTRVLLELLFVRSVSQQMGQAERADDVWGSHYSELQMDLKALSGEAAEFAQADVRRALGQFVGVNFSVKIFLTERMEETGHTAAVVVNI